MKWWNSDIGVTATHAAVFAQLILNGALACERASERRRAWAHTAPCLLLAGEEKGLHVFMVQVRDEEHRPLPGIEVRCDGSWMGVCCSLRRGRQVGDCGPKLGDHGIDTGYALVRTWCARHSTRGACVRSYLRLTNLRVPREAMFAKNAVVTADGRYVPAPSRGGGGGGKAA